MTDSKTFGTSTPAEDLAGKIARGELVAGGIIAEFANGHDAANFARMKGADEYTVTPGINFVFAVRPWIKTTPKAPPPPPVCRSCDDDASGDECTNPGGHRWNRTAGEADEARIAGDYANDNIRCIYCGADGDA